MIRAVLKSNLPARLFIINVVFSVTILHTSAIHRRSSSLEFLQSSKDLSDGSIVVFLDAYDVICVRYEPSHLVADFLSTGNDLIAGAESIFCHHRSEMLPFFMQHYASHSARYLNGEFVIAYKCAYLRMLNYIVTNFVQQFMLRHNNSD